MKRFIPSKILRREILAESDGQAQHWKALQEIRPNRLKPNALRQQAAFKLLKAKWNKGD